jgi:lysine 6-dehydrogenase
VSGFLVLGAGKMGFVLARDLLESDPSHTVTLADSSPEPLEHAAALLASDRLTCTELDVADTQTTDTAFAGSTVAFSALPHRVSLVTLEAALRNEVHFIDLVGEWPEKRRGYDREARERGVTLVSGMGVAPGISNACVQRGVDLLDAVERAVIHVGGVPLEPAPPLNYRIVFAVESVLDAYERPALIIEDGSPTEVPPLSGVEPIRFPAPFGEMECFYTDGLNSLLLTMRERIGRELAEKTIRYPGHAAAIGTLKACGLFSREAIDVGDEPVVPRRMLEQLLDARLRLGKEHDATLLRVMVEGMRGGSPLTHTFELVDRYDPERRVTSMGKTTSFPASIAGQLIADGTIERRGSLFPEEVFRDELGWPSRKPRARPPPAPPGGASRAAPGRRRPRWPGSRNHR